LGEEAIFRVVVETSLGLSLARRRNLDVFLERLADGRIRELGKPVHAAMLVLWQGTRRMPVCAEG
jgi:hypothetical protein